MAVVTGSGDFSYEGAEGSSYCEGKKKTAIDSETIQGRKQNTIVSFATANKTS